MSVLRVDNQGVSVHVEAVGQADAPTVAFLHGVTSSARTWDWLPDAVTAGRRIVRLDFRGHGRSDHAPGTYDVAHYASDVIVALRRAGGPRPAVLVGHSLGGTVAWWLAQRHPELVAAAFLEDPPLLQGEMTRPENEPTRLRFEAMRAAVLADRQASRTEAEVVQRLAATPMGPPGAPPLSELMCDDGVAAMGFGHHQMDIGVLDGAIDGSTLAGLDFDSPVTPPVFILRADDDFGAAFTAARAAELARRYPAVQIAQVAGSGHGIHDERAHRAQFTEHLQRFLDIHAPAAGAGAGE